ncbi:MAG: type II toxin-antitoxin system VapC family toxin [Patescibacteria group bacterium]
MIIDTSVIVKWFYEEAETPIALRLFDRIINHSIRAAVPDLMFYEFANVMKSKGRADGVDVEEALTVLYELPWTIMSHTQHLLTKAINVADLYEISVYDATYVGLALEWHLPLITADEKLVHKVGNSNIQLLRNFS